MYCCLKRKAYGPPWINMALSSNINTLKNVSSNTKSEIVIAPIFV